MQNFPSRGCVVLRAMLYTWYSVTVAAVECGVSRSCACAFVPDRRVFGSDCGQVSVGRTPRAGLSLSCGFGVEYTRRWVDTPGLYTERSYRPWGVTLNLCVMRRYYLVVYNEAVLSRGRGT